MLNDNFLTTADPITNQVNNDNTYDNSPNTDNGNIMSLMSQAYSKNFLPMYSEPLTTQRTENIIDSLKDEISKKILKLSSFFTCTPMNCLHNRTIEVANHVGWCITSRSPIYHISHWATVYVGYCKVVV